MNVILTVYDKGKTKALRRRAMRLLAAHDPKAVAKEDDDQFQVTVALEALPALAKPLRELRGVVAKAKGTAWATFSPEPDELARARFVPLVLYSEVSADVEDDEGEEVPVNALPALCKRCNFPDITRPPSPYLLTKPLAGSVEIARSDDGLLIVRPRVLALLQSAIGKQIKVGDVVVKGRGKPAAADRLHWVRPVHRIGDRPGKDLTECCPTCKRPLTSTAGRGDRPLDAKPGPPVAHFGDGNADLALLDGYFGQAGPDRRFWFWEFAISGALFAHLKDNGVKGIATSPPATRRFASSRRRASPRSKRSDARSRRRRRRAQPARRRRSATARKRAARSSRC